MIPALKAVTAHFGNDPQWKTVRPPLTELTPGSGKAGDHRAEGRRLLDAGSRPGPVTAEEALKRLKEGNARFVSGRARFPTVQKEVLAELAKGQQPYATILGCSDSRVPPELVFDAGFGELFVVRVAGNVLGPVDPGHAAVCGHAPAHAALRRHGPRGLRRGEGRDRLEVSGAAHKSRIDAAAREHPAGAGRSRRDAAARGAAPLGGGGQRAPHGAGTARHAGGEGSASRPAT